VEANSLFLALQPDLIKPGLRMAGVDIGGTKTSTIKIIEGRAVIVKKATPAQAPSAEIARWLNDLVREITTFADQIMVSVPGIVRDGAVVDCDVVPGLIGWRTPPELQAGLVNDAVASLVGARALSGDQGGAVCIAVGTGIGGAWASDSAPTQIVPMEVGALPTDVTAGTLKLDDIASGRALCRAIGCDTDSLPSIVAAGSNTVLRHVAQAGRALGVAVGGMVNLLSPTRVLLVGGLVQVDIYWRAVQDGAKVAAIPELAQNCRIERPINGEHAAVVGAFLLSQSILNHNAGPSPLKSGAE
jgi:glucokinase